MNGRRPAPLEAKPTTARDQQIALHYIAAALLSEISLSPQEAKKLASRNARLATINILAATGLAASPGVSCSIAGLPKWQATE
jgi:hypothetical protein